MDAVWSERELEMVVEGSPVRDHEANGLVENVVKNVQGQFRVLKDSLEGRIQKSVRECRRGVQWLVPHSASVMRRSRSGREGFTQYRRWKGKESTRPAAAFG